MKANQHAIVIGGSMTGLLCARVLASHFERVSIVERDLLPEGAIGRKGVPQGQHVHGFWTRGLELLDGLLPGLSQGLAEDGASTGDLAGDLLWHQFGATKQQRSVGLPGMWMTRPFLESHVRRRVLQLPQVQVVRGAVRGLVADARGSRVTGVALGDSDASLSADLVVDASGRSGGATRWIGELGYAAPAESTVRVDVTYTTRYFTRSARGQHPKGYLISQTPPLGRRAGVCFAVEGERWQLTLAGLAGEEPPTDEPGFLAYARSLPLPQLYDIARSEQALSEAVRFKFPSNLRRHYERLPRFPEGLLVVGDALASFNPTYGQGMTVAALEVEALSQLLSSGDAARIGKRFFKLAARIIDVAWTLATTEDLRFPESPGKRPFWLPMVNAYVARVHAAAASDPLVCRTLFRVAGLELRPERLFTPGFAGRVLLARQPDVSALPPPYEEEHQGQVSRN